MTKAFDKLREEYIASGNDLTVLVKSIYALSRYTKQTSGMDVDWIVGATMQHVRHKLNTKVKDENLGLLVGLLCAYGSTQNQAKQAVAKWVGLKPNSINIFYYDMVKKYKLSGGEDKSYYLQSRSFMRAAAKLPLKLSAKMTDTFPTKWKKAHSAYRKAFHEAERQHLKDLLAMAGLNDSEIQKMLPVNISKPS